MIDRGRFALFFVLIVFPRLATKFLRFVLLNSRFFFERRPIRRVALGLVDLSGVLLNRKRVDSATCFHARDYVESHDFRYKDTLKLRAEPATRTSRIPD